MSYIDYLTASSKNYEIDVEIQWKLPAEMTPNDFYSYPDVKNAPNIGPSLNGTPNQAIGKVSKEACISIFGAINNIFDDCKDRIIEIVGNENFEKIFEIPRLSLQNRHDVGDNDYFIDIADDLAINNDNTSQEKIEYQSQNSIRIDNNQYSVFEMNRKYKKKID
ncbi:hypothetical protein MXZ31_05000 [Streptococcus uberis]|nr:hypothetical protein [Streptococcus uberis]MCK1209208.1 hypothetical protein [Streptococcus uberis]